VAHFVEPIVPVPPLLPKIGVQSAPNPRFEAREHMRGLMEGAKSLRRPKRSGVRSLIARTTVTPDGSAWIASAVGGSSMPRRGFSRKGGSRRPPGTDRAFGEDVRRTRP
jgi:hypothetical protein